MPSAVVPHHGAKGLGNEHAVVRQQFLDGFSGQVRRGFQRLVQVIDIRRMVFAVVDLHRHCIDVRLERRGRVG